MGIMDKMFGKKELVNDSPSIAQEGMKNSAIEEGASIEKLNAAEVYLTNLNPKWAETINKANGQEKEAILKNFIEKAKSGEMKAIYNEKEKIFETESGVVRG